MWWTPAGSGALDTTAALADVIGALDAAAAAADAPGPQLALVFFSHHHAAQAADIGVTLRQRWPDLRVVGASGAGVSPGGAERGPALAITLAHLPEVAIRPQHLHPDEVRRGAEEPAFLRRRLALPGGAPPCLIALFDPATVDGEALCVGLDGAFPDSPKAGSGAAGGDRPGDRMLLLDDQVHTSGALVLALHGNIAMAVESSQGATPLGRPLEVTAAEGRVITELDGKPAVLMLDSVSAGFRPAERDAFRAAPLIGLAFDPDRRGKAGDYRVCDLLALNRGTGAIAINGAVEEGDHLQLHLREPQAARAQLDEALARQARGPAPRVGLLFTSHTRGTHFFGAPHVDAQAVAARFSDLPLICLHGDGELGPAHGATRHHRHAAVIAFLRPRDWS